MQNLSGGNIVFLAIAAFIIICIFLGVRIVPQSEKHVVERFGRLRHNPHTQKNANDDERGNRQINRIPAE